MHRPMEAGIQEQYVSVGLYLNNWTAYSQLINLLLVSPTT